MTDTVERLQHALPEHYAVERELGRGGMATVYLAEDRRHHRKVALKVLLPELANVVGRARFLREIEIEAGLAHPGIVPLFDSGGSDEFVYYVMPFVEGESLRDRLDRERQLPFEDALRIVREVGEALAYAHARGVVHRDVKPANILLGSARAVVTDFGIARAVSIAGGERVSSAGLAVGTPAYMSPEQAAAGEVDQRTDVYALACVLYEMLAGDPPFTGATPQAVMARARTEAPPSLEVVRPGVGGAVQGVVERALAKVAADRYRSVPEFLAELERAAAAPESGEYVRSRPVRARRLGVAAVVAMVVGAVGLWHPWAPRIVLDPNKLVVFPLFERGLTALAGEGSKLSLMISRALEQAEPLKVYDGWMLLDPARKRELELLSEADARRIARSQGAGYLLDGSIVQSGDTGLVAVRLLDVRRDSVVAQVSEAGLVDPAALAQTALRAVVDLLPRFLGTGRRVDLGPLLERQPSAIASWLLGEADYREARFDAAMAHYQRALELDSQLVFASLKGAQAASWSHRQDSALTLAALASRHVGRVPAKYRHFAAGLLAYLSSDPDSATAAYHRAITLDSAWTEAWMALGEVHYHFIFGGYAPDSLAEQAFEQARRLDPRFTPALFHLSEIALRRGWSRLADTLVRAFRAAGPDSNWYRQVILMALCRRDGPDAVDWERTARSSPGAPASVMQVGHALAAAGAQPVCAERAFRAALDAAPPESSSTRFGAVAGLQALLAAEGRSRDVRTLLAVAVHTVHPAVKGLQVADAAAGLLTDSGAADAIRDLGGDRPDYHGLRSSWLWYHGEWAWHRRDAARLANVVDALAANVRTSRTEKDTLIHKAMAARLALLRADTARALTLLGALTPRGEAADIGWDSWAPLGEERLLLAKLLLARGRAAEALEVAGVFDSQQPMSYLLYLPASLEVRVRAAEALGRRDLVARYRERLGRIGAKQRG